MKFLYFIAVLISLPILLNCSSAKKQQKMGFEKIIFGSGGGITGMAQSYSIDNHGVLMNENTKTKMISLRKQELKELNKTIDNTGILNSIFDQPGNFYYYIEVQKRGEVNKLTWSDQNKASEDVLRLYQHLVNLTNQNKK